MAGVNSDRDFVPNPYTRFFQKVDTKKFDAKECWHWLGCGKGNGYGSVRIGEKNMGAHRYSFELFVGKIPEGMEVCHACDNRYCVNPDHLFLGTRKENMEDCKAKGRTYGGPRKHLIECQVQEIMRMHHGGMNPRQISHFTKIGYGVVVNVIKGKTYNV